MVVAVTLRSIARIVAASLLSLGTGCASVKPIEDGARFGSVDVVEDWFTSAVVITTSEGPVMVDAGFRPRRMRRALADRGVDPRAVDRILVTHGHRDHLDALPLYEGVPIFAVGSEVEGAQSLRAGRTASSALPARPASLRHRHPALHR